MKPKPVTPRNDPPVNLVVPSTIELKMTAMVNLSEAIRQLSIALASTNVVATISNNVISNVKTGISLDTQ